MSAPNAPQESETIPVFDHYPTAMELFRSGGRPGFSYAHVTPANIGRAQTAGWRLLIGVELFTVKGPLGSVELITVGSGDAIPGASPGQSTCQMYVDKAAEQATGIQIDEDEVVDLEGDENAQAQGKSHGKGKGPQGDPRVSGGPIAK